MFNTLLKQQLHPLIVQKPEMIDGERFIAPVYPLERDYCFIKVCEVDGQRQKSLCGGGEAGVSRCVVLLNKQFL